MYRLDLKLLIPRWDPASTSGLPSIRASFEHTNWYRFESNLYVIGFLKPKTLILPEGSLQVHNDPSQLLGLFEHINC